MKRKTLIQSTLFALASFTFVTVISAQDESQTPPPGDNPPAPSLEAPSSLRDSSTPTSTPEQTPTPARESTPKATPAASASASKSTSAASPAERKRARVERDEEETTTRATRNAAPDVGPDRGSPEANIKRLENGWEGAVKAHDVGFLQARVAEDFIGVSSRGKRLNKSSLIKDFKSDNDTYTSAKNTGIVLRVIDKDVVVASGIAKEVGRNRDGKPFSRSYIWTDTWAMRGDRWQCVASHVMLEAAR